MKLLFANCQPTRFTPEMLARDPLCGSQACMARPEITQDFLAPAANRKRVR